MTKNIAIVGAGWVGIGCARILSESNYSIDIYEQNDDLGGVWHPSNCYAGLSIHSPVKQVQYFDFPLQENLDLTERVSSKQIYAYLKQYCIAKDIYKRMIFNTRVFEINYHSENRQITLSFQDKENNIGKKTYDYIIYTHGFTNRNLPTFQKINFSGSILHSFEVTAAKLESFIMDNKKIVILGGSKTATDFVLYLYKYGYQFTWLYRKSYWFMRYDLYRDVLERKKLNKKPNYLFYFAAVLGFSLTTFPKIQFYLWRLFRIIHTYKYHSDFKKFHFGWLDDSQMKNLKLLNAKYGVEGEIERLENNGIYLKDGRFIPADVLICCTGSGGDKPNVDFKIDDKTFPIENVYEVYQARVIPQIPNLIFTAFHTFGLGTVNGLNQGKWIEKYILLHPNSDYLIKHSTVFNYPFFTVQQLFASNDYLLRSNLLRTADFFKSGELSKNDFRNWVIHEYFFNINPAKPLNFNLPKFKD